MTAAAPATELRLLATPHDGAARRVDRVGDWLEVSRINTATDAAKVVELLSIRYLTHEQSVAGGVRFGCASL